MYTGWFFSKLHVTSKVKLQLEIRLDFDHATWWAHNLNQSWTWHWIETSTSASSFIALAKDLVWICKHALWKAIYDCFLPCCLLPCSHVRCACVPNAFFVGQLETDWPGGLTIAQKSGENDSPEVVATAAFPDTNPFHRKQVHIVTCIAASWFIGIAWRRRERREKWVNGYCGEQIGPECDSFKHRGCFISSWYERRSKKCMWTCKWAFTLIDWILVDGPKIWYTSSWG